MTDCSSTLAALLPTSTVLTSTDDHVDVSSFTTTSESSPPYSSEHHSPTDQRTETPDSGNQSYSPENVATSFESSDRDASPDNLSTSSTNMNDVDKNINLNMDEELQRQLLRYQQDFKDSIMENNPNTINLMSAFNQQLFKTTFANSLGTVTPTLGNLPTGISLASSPCTTPTVVEQSVPTKRKRQRRNPVWPYFDVIDGTARCKQCLYSTKSVFSTNLKVHLRSHHRADYDKVILAEDALNLNAYLLSGNSSKIFNVDANRKRMPPMTSSILMTINKLVNQQQNGEENPLNAVLRQTLATNGLQQHLQQVQTQLQAAQAAVQKQQVQQQQQQAAQQQAQQAQQQAQQQQMNNVQQFTLNAANLAALNQLARNQIPTPTPPIPNLSQDHIMQHLNFPAHIKNEIINAPHGTDANGVPQPKRRRLRRHPVWMFFRDLEDRMVGCINCEFKTGSAFSTNLKMHLKAHHKEDYERVLQLEEEMRLEEGCIGTANKFKSELIDYIRGGGNASTTTTPTNGSNGFNTPKASPLVQQIISQTMARSQSPTNGQTQQQPSTNKVVVKKEELDDEPSFMSSTEKLAALVGISQNNQNNEEVKTSEPFTMPSTFEELRQAAERLFAANNFGNILNQSQSQIQQQQQQQTNTSIIASETKSTCSTASDPIDDRKSERDRALARLWAENESIISNNLFREFINTLAPEYEIPDSETLALHISDQD